MHIYSIYYLKYIILCIFNGFLIWYIYIYIFLVYYARCRIYLQYSSGIEREEKKDVMIMFHANGFHGQRAYIYIKI